MIRASLHKIQNIAQEYHAKNANQQTYLDDHLHGVYNIAMSYFPSTWNYQDKINVEDVCYLHDLIEDTDFPVEDLCHFTSLDAVHSIHMLSDGHHFSSRKIKKLFSYHMIRSDRYATYVKLCDRLQNRNRQGKADMYDKEFDCFLAAFWNPYDHQELWKALFVAHNRDFSEFYSDFVKHAD